MKRKFLLGLAVALIASVASAQTGGLKERNLSPELYRTVNRAIDVYNATGATITATSLVYVCGWAEATSTATGAPSVRRLKVCDADADVAGYRAQYIVTNAIANSGTGVAYRYARVGSLDTSAAASVGQVVYASGTAGGWTLTAPTAPSVSQVVGRVAVDSATVGVIEFNLENENPSWTGLDITAGSIGADDLGLTVRAGTNLAAGDLVYLSSYNATDGFIASVADADVDGAQAVYVATGTIASGSTGRVYKAASATLDTSLGGVGDPVYLTITGTTTNSMSLSPPTGADDVVQIVGRIVVVDASGTVAVNLLDFVPEVGTNQLMDDSVTNDKLANITRGSVKVGGASDAPTDLVALTASQILLGDGTDVNSVALSGLADISTAGKTTLDLRFKQFQFRDPASLILSDMSAVPTAAAAETIQASFPEGTLFEYVEEQVGAPTPASLIHTTSAYGIDFGLDDTADDGIQLGPPQHTGGESFTGQTDAFYAKIQFRLEDASGTDPLCLCVMTPQAYADIDALADVNGNYGGAGEEIACICTGTGAGTDPAVLHQYSEVGGGGVANNAFTTSDHECADLTTYTWEIDVDAAGAVTFKVDGNAPGGGGAALTLSADEFFPIVLHNSSADVNANFYLSLFEWGLQ